MGCVFSYNVISNFDWVWDDRNFVKLEKKKQSYIITANWENNSKNKISPVICQQFSKNTARLYKCCV